MTNQINSRIVTVGIQVVQPAVSGVGPALSNFMLFEGLDIRAQGQKFAGPESNTCIVQISNLTQEQRKWLLTVATPWLPTSIKSITPVLVTLSVGRSGIGSGGFSPFLLFQGYCYASNVTMPPEISITLTSTVNNVQASLMEPQEFGALTNLSIISGQIAAKYKLNLNFTAADKQIANFNYTGGLQTAVNKLRKLGVHVQTSHDTLSIYDIGSTVGNSQPFILNTSTGMVSIPETTQNGVKVMCLIRPEIQPGAPITIQSKVNPAANGTYFINTVDYHITNRDDPFWYELFCNYINEEGTTP